MEQAISQETVSDSSHSRIPKGNESNASSSSLKSAAMLGIALSVGASGALVSQTEASAAVSTPTTSATTKAFSSDSSTSAATNSGIAASQRQVVAYHTVASGESLWQIAQQHGVGLHELKSANSLPPESSIRVGQTLMVPGGTGGGLTPSVDSSPSVAQLMAGISNVASREALQTRGRRFSQQVSTQPTTAPQISGESAEIAQSVDLENLQSSGVRPPSKPLVSIEIEISEDSQREHTGTSVITALAAPAATFSRYQVQAGDTLVSIAAALGTTPEALVQTNALADPDMIFAGATLRVPSAQPVETIVANKADTTIEQTSALQQSRSANERLAHLRSTASYPNSARILDNLRSISPSEAMSVGGERVTEQDLLATKPNGATSDPYVASLMAEVQEIRNHSVQFFEADRALLASADQARSIPRIRSRRVNQLTETVTPAEESTNLLAAAPLSPDAYVPAQRSSTGQVVSPDMPILPAADEFLPETPNYFEGYIWPAAGTVTSGYGWRWGRMHRGVDVAGPVGTPIVAAAPGVVEQAGWNSGGYGNLVEIRHPDGSMTRYAHNNSLNVSVGQTVRQGQQIAEMGSTGYSTGPHLHFEVHKSGGAVNPVAYLPSR